MITTCTCPGSEAVFECAVDGGGATIWQGTALEECAGGRIILRHSQFESGYNISCLLYTSPSPRDATLSRMPSSA